MRLLAGALCLALLAVAHSADASANSSSSEPRRSLQARRAPGARRAQAPLGAGFWSVRGSDFVDGSGNVVHFSGVTWSGFETPIAVVHGLEKRTYASHLDQMRALGFNMIRMPFAGDTLLPTTVPRPNIWMANPDLWGLNSLQVMDKIIKAAGDRGIKVILDYHRLHLTDQNENGLWWDKTTPESVWINNWVTLARMYKGNPNVIGADLFNEPHPCLDKTFGCPDGAPFWVANAGANERFNYRSAVQRAIAAVHPVNPGWIFFIEGMWQGYWWGGNVTVLETAPITSLPAKIAYSTHEYGPYVHPLDYFFEKTFPNNLFGLYQQNWGWIQQRGIKPIWVGEFGSFLPPPTTRRNSIERQTFIALISYMKRLGVSWTLAFWNPDSKDTGGILKTDYQSVETEKYNVLRRILKPGFRQSP